MTTSTSAPVPVTGTQYEIAAGGYRASITSVGGGLRELTCGGRPLVLSHGPDELPPGASGQLLAPWPNRIDRGRYTFGGGSHQLDITEPDAGTAIHGLVRWAAWEPVEREPHRLRLAHVLHGRPGYPFVLAFEVEYALDPDAGLYVGVTATNAGSRPAPYGNGAHPYLTPPDSGIDGCHVTIPGARRLPTDERGIPDGGTVEVAGTPYDFRRHRPLGDLAINYAYTELDRDPDGRAWARLADAAGGTGAALWLDETYGWLQVYTGEQLAASLRRAALAIEPMTCPPNAFANGQDVITLGSGKSTTSTWGITATTPS